MTAPTQADLERAREITRQIDIYAGEFVHDAAPDNVVNIIASALAQAREEQRQEDRSPLPWQKEKLKVYEDGLASGRLAGIEEARQKLRELEDARRPLVEALKKYGVHDGSCDHLGNDCSCGFDAALAAEEGEK